MTKTPKYDNTESPEIKKDSPDVKAFTDHEDAFIKLKMVQM